METGAWQAICRVLGPLVPEEGSPWSIFQFGLWGCVYFLSGEWEEREEQEWHERKREWETETKEIIQGRGRKKDMLVFQRNHFTFIALEGRF